MKQFILINHFCGFDSFAPDEYYPNERLYLEVKLFGRQVPLATGQLCEGKFIMCKQALNLNNKITRTVGLNSQELLN